MKKILTVIFMLTVFCQAKATHIPYMDLTYNWISGSTYELTLTLYRQCSSPAAPTSVPITCCSPSGGSGPTTIALPVAGTGLPIFPVCAPPLSVCLGGTSIGFEKYVYKGNCTLPSQKSDWTFKYALCCRESFITTIPSPLSVGLEIRAQLDNLNFEGNSSPTFNDEPIVFACCNQSFSYNQSATDADGDSLYYSLWQPLDGVGSCASPDSIDYLPGYSYLQPVTSSPSLSMNGNTGYVTMYPTVCSQVSIMGIKVESYRGGQFMGYISRDNLIIITNESITTELPETAAGSDLFVFPNPFTATFTVSGIKSQAKAAIYDLLGNKILFETVNGTEQELDLSAFSNGIYFLKIETENEIILKKIIKE